MLVCIDWSQWKCLSPPNRSLPVAQRFQGNDSFVHPTDLQWFHQTRNAINHAASEVVPRFAISATILCAIRAADVFTDSRAG